MGIKIPNLILWGMQDVALTNRIERPGLDHCDNGRLILFPDSTHWVQLDAAKEVNHYPIEFLLDNGSKRVIG